MKKYFDYFVGNSLLGIISIGTVFSLLIVSILFQIGISLSGSKQSMIYVYDIFFGVLWIYLFFYLLSKRKKIEDKYLGEEKTLGFLAIVFGAYFIFVIIIKIFIGESIDNSTILLRPLLWPCALYISLSINENIAKKLVFVIAILFSILNIVMVLNMVFLVESIRKIKVLGNINTAMNVQLYGVIFWYIFVCYTKVKNKKQSIAIKSLAAFNIMVAIFTSMGSGTRLFFPLIFYTLVILISINRVKLRVKLKRLAYLLISVILIFLTFLNLNILNSEYNIYRTFSYVEPGTLNVFNFARSNSELEIDQAIKAEEKAEAQEEAEQSIALSNDMRGVLWRKSLDMVSENLLFGVGDITVEVKMYDDNVDGGYRILRQAPHNFILEVLLSVGVIGMILYMLILSTPLIYVLTSRVRLFVKVNVALVYTAIIIPSLFQPLITTKLILGLSFWLILAIIRNMVEPKGLMNESNKSQYEDCVNVISLMGE